MTAKVTITLDNKVTSNRSMSNHSAFASALGIPACPSNFRLSYSNGFIDFTKKFESSTRAEYRSFGGKIKFTIFKS